MCRKKLSALRDNSLIAGVPKIRNYASLNEGQFQLFWIKNGDCILRYEQGQPSIEQNHKYFAWFAKVDEGASFCGAFLCGELKGSKHAK